MYDTADAGTEEAQRCNGQTEAFAAIEPKVVFKQTAIVEGLTAALAIAKMESLVVTAAVVCVPNTYTLMPMAPSASFH